MKIVSMVAALMTLGSVSFAQTFSREVSVERLTCYSVFEGVSTVRVSGEKAANSDKLNLTISFKDANGIAQESVMPVTQSTFYADDSNEAVVINAATANESAELSIDLYNSDSILSVNDVRQDYLKLVCDFDFTKK